MELVLLQYFFGHTKCHFWIFVSNEESIQDDGDGEKRRDIIARTFITNFYPLLKYHLKNISPVAIRVSFKMLVQLVEKLAAVRVRIRRRHSSP